MKLLLDTHIWVWIHLAPDRVRRRVARELESPENELWLSPISLWELGMLCERGRVVLNQGVDAWVSNALRTFPLHEAPITHEVALETSKVRLAHRDPADRFLAATARIFELTLVTADRQLARVRDVRVLVNR
ncbi:MAG: type II toxin-antitoxin system VapC family toxin [Acidobacteria bacterium]|nr:type II toxin-antitoxin system VapC family toxin [Acidobacteriota bacterium]